MRSVRFIVRCAVIAVLVAAACGSPAGADNRLGEWWEVDGPAAGAPAVFGAFSLGCVSGGAALALNGPGYQVMRPSRERYYGHPTMVRFVQSLARTVAAAGWSDLLIGDMAQPRGGPMQTGHQSHQTGLDVDIWFLAAPAPVLSMNERESLSAVSMLDDSGWRTGDRFTAREKDILRRAAQTPDVRRIFVHPAIKQTLCETAGTDRDWLAKIRPWWGHHYHFHVRLHCPDGDAACVDQPPPGAGDGCDDTLAWWFSDEARQQAEAMAKAPKTRTPIPLDALPAQCRAVLAR